MSNKDAASVGEKRQFPGGQEPAAKRKRVSPASPLNTEERELYALFELSNTKLAKAVALLSRIIENIKNNPYEIKFRSLRYDSIKKREIDWPGVIVFLEQSGFQMQKHEFVRLVLEDDQMGRFHETCDRFDKIIKFYMKQKYKNDPEFSVKLKDWCTSQSFRLSKNASEALRELKNNSSTDPLLRLHAFADLSHEIPIEVALKDKCSQVTADRVRKYIQKGNVLEIGCGVGDFGVNLSRLESALKLDGVDISKMAIGHARKSRIYRHLFIGDVNQKLNLEPNCYDAIVSSNCLFLEENLYPDPKCLHKLFTHLKPGGYFIVGIKVRNESDIDVIRHYARFEAIFKSMSNLEMMENSTAHNFYRLFVWKKKEPELSKENDKKVSEVAG